MSSRELVAQTGVPRQCRLVAVLVPKYLIQQCSPLERVRLRVRPLPSGCGRAGAGRSCRRIVRLGARLSIFADGQEEKIYSIYISIPSNVRGVRMPAF